jgi:hypothetical protein
MARTIVVVDGMGGGIGSQIIARIRKDGLAGAAVLALGTNAVAAQRMVDAGADRGASGENAFRVTLARADFVLGPLGVALPDAMMGEVTAEMARAVISSPGRKLLLPLTQQHVEIVGLAQRNVADLVAEAVGELARLLASERSSGSG